MKTLTIGQKVKGDEDKLTVSRQNCCQKQQRKELKLSRRFFHLKRDAVVLLRSCILSGFCFHAQVDGSLAAS